MQQTLYFKTHQSSNGFLLSYPIAIMPTSLYNTAIFAPKLFFTRSSILASHPTHIQNPIICARKTDKLVIYARKNKRRNGSQISKKLLFGLIAIMASKTKILPQPLDLVVGEIGHLDGNGVAVWFWKFFGGGGFDGRRRNNKRKSMLLVFSVICGLAFLFGKELERNVLCGFSVLGLLGVLSIQWSGKRKTKDWVLGFCLGGALVGLGLRRGEMQKWVERLRVCSPIMVVGRRRGRK